MALALSATLLLLNFPLAFLYTNTSGLVVDVTNRGTKTLRAVELYTPGHVTKLGDVAVGESARARVASSGDRALEVVIPRDDGTKRATVVEGYIIDESARYQVQISDHDEKVTRMK